MRKKEKERKKEVRNKRKETRPNIFQDGFAFTQHTNEKVETFFFLNSLCNEYISYYQSRN